MMLTNEKINELLGKGFKRWQKGNLDRLYINATQLGLECTYYKTGNVSSACFKGESISNCQARRYKMAKTYIDVKDGHGFSDIPALMDAAMELAGLAD